MKKMSGDWIMGKNSLREMLQYQPEQILCVYTVQTREKEKLLLEIERKKIPLSFVSKQELFSLVQSESHQSFVAKVKRKNFLDLSTFLEQEKKDSFVLLLDSIYDPQNVGALLRSAECFGVDAVVFSKNRGSPITPVVAKASSGASELIPLIEVSNLADSLLKFQDEGYQVVLADLQENAKEIQTFSFPEKTVLVAGSEGIGIQQRIRQMADQVVKIPLVGKIDSLNVAQATAIILFYWKVVAHQNGFTK